MRQRESVIRDWRLATGSGDCPDQVIGVGSQKVGQKLRARSGLEPQSPSYRPPGPGISRKHTRGLLNAV